MLDLVIRGRTVVTPQGVGACDVAVQGEKIVALCDIDESMLTGESVPVIKGPGDRVTGGAVNSLAIQSNGAIVIAGGFSQVNGVAHAGIAPRALGLHQPERLAVVALDHLIDPRRAVALSGLRVFGQVVADRQLGIGEPQVVGDGSTDGTASDHRDIGLHRAPLPSPPGRSRR